MSLLRRLFVRRSLGSGKQQQSSRRRKKAEARLLNVEPLELRALLAGDFGFAHGFGSASRDLGNAVIADAQGNVYMTGEFRNTVDFDPGTGVSNLVGQTNGLPYTYITKYSAAGDLVWAKSLNSASMNWGSDLTIDSAGNLWVLGTFHGSTDFDPGPGQANIAPRSAAEVFLLKLDANGNYLSAGAFQGGGLFGGVAADLAGNVYLTGQYSATDADLDPGPGTATFNDNGGFDAFVSKVGSDGNLIWAKSFGGTSTSGNGDYGQDIAVDSNGNPFITGTFLGTVDFDPGAGTTSRTSTGSSAVFTTKYDANGNFQWVAVIDSSGTEPQDIAVDGSGNVITTGGLQSTVDFDPGAGVFNLVAPSGFYGAYIVKLDGSGSFQWAKQLGTTAGSGTYGYGLSMGANEDIFSTGQFSGTGDFDPGAGAANMTAAGSIDVYVSRLTSSGSFVSARRMGGTVLDRGLSVAFSAAASGVFVSGQFNGTADFDPGAGTVSRTSAGSDDIFVAKLYTAPYFTSAAAYAVDENTTAVGTLSATDPEGQAVSYSISGGADAALFSVDLNSGALTFNAPPNFEDAGHGPSYAIQVAASDGVNISTQSLSITVNNDNEQPTAVELSEDTVNEGQPVGTEVGTLSTTDPDAGDTFTYSLVAGTGDEGNASFTIEGNVLKTAATFSAVAQSSYSIRVHSQDAGGAFLEQEFTITVLATNHGPTGISLQGDSIAENQPSGTEVGTFTTTDEDAGDSFTYTFVAGAGDTDNASFAISGNTLQTAAGFNFEAKDTYSIRVRSTDAASQWVEETFVITVEDANDLPAGSVVVTGEPSEDAALSADASGITDEDGLGTLHYQWQRSTDNFVTTVNVGSDSTGYQLSDADVGASVRVVVSYVDGRSTSESVASAVVGPIANINDAPELDNTLNPSLGSIQEDALSPASKLVSSLLAGAVIDPDPAAKRGIAVTEASADFGTWQYSLNGTTWQGMGTPASDAALLLPASARVRFLPQQDFTGQVSLVYRAWDQTQGSIGGTLDLSEHTGGANSLSTTEESAPLAITSVNDPPKLNVTLNPTLGSIQEDAKGPAGTEVSALLVGAVTDPDAGAQRGIAVVIASTSNGVWQYRLPGSNAWQAMGNVSDGAALLLPSDVGTRVRFIPKAEFNGTVRLYYRAWDRTQGSVGGTFDAGANLQRKDTAFSDKESAPLIVAAVNDKPVLRLSGTTTYVHDKPAITLAPFATVTDVDSVNFGGGQLRVRIGQGLSSSNRLAIGDGFTIDSSKNVKQGSTIIGKLTSSGFGTKELVITFNFAAKTTIVQQLVRSITFKTVGGTAGVREVFFSVSDGDGGTSLEALKNVTVT